MGHYYSEMGYDDLPSPILREAQTLSDVQEWLMNEQYEKVSRKELLQILNILLKDIQK